MGRSEHATLIYRIAARRESNYADGPLTHFFIRVSHVSLLCIVAMYRGILQPMPPSLLPLLSAQWKYLTLHPVMLACWLVSALHATREPAHRSCKGACCLSSLTLIFVHLYLIHFAWFFLPGFFCLIPRACVLSVFTDSSRRRRLSPCLLPDNTQSTPTKDKDCDHLSFPPRYRCPLRPVLLSPSLRLSLAHPQPLDHSAFLIR